MQDYPAGKSIALRAIDQDKNIYEDTTYESAPLSKLNMVLHPDTTDATGLNPIDVTFTDTYGNFKTNIYSVTATSSSEIINLTASVHYTLGSGKLTIKAGVLSTPQSYTIIVKAAGYNDSYIGQPIGQSTTAAPAISGTITAVAGTTMGATKITISTAIKLPTFIGKTVNKTQLVMIAGSNLNLSTPAAAVFTVKIGSTPIKVNDVDMLGRMITLTLVDTVFSTAGSVNITYSMPLVNPIMDDAGNKVAPFVTSSVLNCSDGPILFDASATAGASDIVIIMDKAVTKSSSFATGTFKVRVNGTDNSIVSPEVISDNVVLILLIRFLRVEIVFMWILHPTAVHIFMIQATLKQVLLNGI